LQNWRTIDGSDLATCVERVMAATDSESRPGPSVTLRCLMKSSIGLQLPHRSHPSI
jgi:hypothetical protein